MTDLNPDDIEKRLDAGERLSVTEVTALLKPHRRTLNRTTVHRWIKAGKIRVVGRTPGGQRTCDPEDVRRILDEMRGPRAEA
jgi:DNA-binding transcriptional MerR regulator